VTPPQTGGEAAVNRPQGRLRGFLGLGSNIGDRRAHLQAAVDALPRHGVRVRRCSATYDTEPVGLILDQPVFLNACVEIETEHQPAELLAACKEVEREVGRAAGGPRHGPRVIDVDLLLLGDLQYESERLRLPHEQVTSRRFVLVPLLELDPDLTVPRGERLAGALAALGGGQQVHVAGLPLSLPSPDRA
jgi:2-amino-4-hydroxy-6-hydroxymethyldihydropteridine diphosphokinase